MPTMIILKAKADSGKTSTFRELAKFINNDVSFKKKESKEIIIHTNSQVITTNKYDDFILIVSNCCNKKIAIISGGDKPKTLKARLDDVYKKHGDIDILFGACRTKGSTVKTVKGFAKDKFELIFTSTYQNKKNHELLNTKRAKELFGLIQTEDIFKI